MSFDLNELRAQRERIREHLAWLDARIAAAEGKPADKDQAEPAAPHGATVAPKPETTPAVAADTAPTPTAAESTSTPAPDALPPQVEAVMGSGPGGFSSSSKVGCIIAGVLVAGLVLFLLFGLPFLLY